jgi:hypothetical protein
LSKDCASRFGELNQGEIKAGDLPAVTSCNDCGTAFHKTGRSGLREKMEGDSLPEKGTPELFDYSS